MQPATSPVSPTIAALSIAATDRERAAVSALLAGLVDAGTAVAVPAAKLDPYYEPIVVQAKTAEGRLVGAILTRRAPMAVAYFTGLDQGLGRVEYEAELDRVSFLDLVGVDPEFRGKGIATALLAEAEARLAARGTRVWFGGIPRSATSVPIAGFFEGHGFQVLQTGQKLPTFLGRRWTLPHTADPHNWFYKRVAAPVG